MPAPRNEEAARSRLRFGRAWVGLTLALAVHVADEAVNDFLSVYNPAVRAIRQRIGFFPMPTFTFDVWLAGLITAVAVLLLLSTFAFRGARWMRPLAFGFGVLMLANGAGHFLGSLYLGRAMPGVYSSPLLMACALYLLRAAASLAQDSAGHSDALE